ncbi:hypothetical protein [Brevibacillus laterosporus]|uniref:hypothetical protein n=1 Tax=Brevibacillus laterosporus TaxID=1465 RepID=UPI003D1AFDB7
MGQVTKIKIYDVRKLIELENIIQDNRQLTTHIQHELAIIEGVHGVTMFCQEGVGRVLKGMDDVFELELSPAPERDDDGNPKTICIMPTGMALITPKEIVEKAVHKEVEIKDFIRQFGSRLEENFSIQLDTIRKIGLNPNDYYEGGRKKVRSRF